MAHLHIYLKSVKMQRLQYNSTLVLMFFSIHIK